MSHMPTLHHRVDGSGPHVVLLHPVGLDLTFFDPVVVELRSRYSVLRVDMRGHGGSPPVPSPYRLENYADDIHALMADLGWTPSAVVGFSFGGMVAQMLALSHHDAVNVLVVGACPSTLPDETRKVAAERGALAEREGMRAVLESTVERWFTEGFRKSGADAAVRRRLLSDDIPGWAQAWRAISEIDTAPRLNSIQIPTLCLAGELDAASPPAVVEAIANEVPGARFAVLPGAPHMMFIEQPQEVAAAISSFLGDVLPQI